MMDPDMDRWQLEELRKRKRDRHFGRLQAATTIEYEYGSMRLGRPSSYAFVKFACAPANDLSFDSEAVWPPSVDAEESKRFELAIAEGVADVLLDGLYQNSGCVLTLTEVRYDEVGSSEAAFMKAAREAMSRLLNEKWTLCSRDRAKS
jgi:hypothetical protein